MSEHAYQTESDVSGGHALKYFMWGYQPHTRVAMSTAADRVFAALAPGLHPSMHLIGFLDEERPDRHPICIEPEDDGFHPEQFAGAKSLAETLQSAGDGTMYLHPSKAVADRFEERDRRSYLRKAVGTILAQTQGRSGTIAFCGYPERVEGFLVIPVLQLNRVIV